MSFETIVCNSVEFLNSKFDVEEGYNIKTILLSGIITRKSVYPSGRAFISFIVQLLRAYITVGMCLIKKQYFLLRGTNYARQWILLMEHYRKTKITGHKDLQRR